MAEVGVESATEVLLIEGKRAHIVSSNGIHKGAVGGGAFVGRGNLLKHLLRDASLLGIACQ